MTLSVQSFAKLPNDYVIIERSRGLSLLEEKLVYMLINSMQKRYEDSKREEQFDYNYIASASISFDEFVENMQIGSTNRKEIALALENLILFAIAIRTSKQDRFLTMFTEFIADYETNTIAYRFNDSFIMYFTDICKDYFKLSVQEVIALNSTHAIRIYQILKTKQNMTQCAFEYNVLELKKMINIQDKYKLYSDFKRKVIELAKQQINNSEASQFNIDYEEIKTGKAVTSIKFHILKKGKNYYDENGTLPRYKLDLIKK
ncbi:MAG: hypothetical protein RL027_546, partial [Pseudomonadota bacterium]